jgi:hypothetical protein
MFMVTLFFHSYFLNLHASTFQIFLIFTDYAFKCLMLCLLFLCILNFQLFCNFKMAYVRILPSMSFCLSLKKIKVHVTTSNGENII